MSTTTTICTHCTETFECDHPDEHPGLCCDCLDLSCGKPLTMVNEDRVKAGRAPVRPWPGRGVDGKRKPSTGSSYGYREK